MSGSLFSAALTLVVGLIFVAFIGAGFIWIVPILLLALIPLLSGSLLAKVRNSSVVQDEPKGIPSTQQSSYTPQFDPSDRPT
ncbi:MAG: hypothetical protein JWO90_3286 [Solirubrobacterales bacterium]|jgi:hypothetical protein|nr:hypothetical protein [Solirubrobacterales bacterium]